MYQVSDRDVRVVACVVIGLILTIGMLWKRPRSDYEEAIARAFVCTTEFLDRMLTEDQVVSMERKGSVPVDFLLARECFAGDDGKDYALDPWGSIIRVRVVLPTHFTDVGDDSNWRRLRFYSIGPNKTDEFGLGDDIESKSQGLRLEIAHMKSDNP